MAVICKPLVALAGLSLAGVAAATEYPIGEARARHGLEIGAVYLQPIRMDPPGHMRPAADSDVHLEADISALTDNPNGLAEGAWVPYLSVGFTVEKLDSGETVSGEFVPMVASDGPHYGDNVQLFGYGRYRLTYRIEPPEHFGRHTDRLTGVAPWFEPFELSWTFIYSGIGKKGGY